MTLEDSAIKKSDDLIKTFCIGVQSPAVVNNALFVKSGLAEVFIKTLQAWAPSLQNLQFLTLTLEAKGKCISYLYLHS